jgi:hypothetical protein
MIMSMIFGIAENECISLCINCVSALKCTAMNFSQSKILTVILGDLKNRKSMILLIKESV